MLNRATLDVAIPMIFGIAMATLAITVPDAIAVFAVVGGGIVGLYFAAFRRNLPE